MEIYKFISLDTDDILLQRVIIDNINYTIINKENGDILLKKNDILLKKNIMDIKNYDFAKSSILECFINNTKINKLKYSSVLRHIYYLINNGTKIIKYTKLNIKTLKKENEGFYYLHDIGISVQNVDSNKSILEIVNQCLENKIELLIKVKLSNKSIIKIDLKNL